MMASGEAGQTLWTQESLRELAAQKEQEWRQVQQLRSESLEAALNEKEKCLREEHAKFTKLKEDFKYNLRLLNERDSELDRYDSVFSELKSKLSHKDAEISELKIKIDEHSSTIHQEAKIREELQSHYQQRIREKQTEMDKYRCDKDNEIQKERNDLESFKRNLQRQLRELEEELEIQKRELDASYEEAMRKREHEFRKQADEMSSTVLSHEMKVKLLSKELELVKCSEADRVEQCEGAEDQQKELEKKLKHKHWELEDLKAMKDTRISELQGKLQNAETNLKKAQDSFQIKYAELDRQVKEKDCVISKLRESTEQREKQLTDYQQRLQTGLEECQLKLRQAEWRVQDVEKEKEAIMERFTNELSEVKSRWEAHVSEISHSNVHRDVELEALRKDVGQLKTDLTQRKHDIERYKKELTEAIEREAGLERINTQLDLDWQRRYEGVERDQYNKAEHLIKNLTDARDTTQAELKEKQRELLHHDDVIKLLTRERDAALATLKQHGIKLDHNINVGAWQSEPGSESEQVSVLEAQNEHLRQVIRQMRHEMEELGDTIPGSNTARSTRSEGRLVANEYVKNLEEELRKVKSKCRQLEQQTADGVTGSKVDNTTHAQALEAAGDNTFMRNHIEQLNTSIGSLRSEKVELTTQLKKQQTRLQYLESALDQAVKQPREKQARVQQLEYELSAQTRRHDAELSSLKSRVSELELQLAETRKEADEYHKSNIEHNLEVTALHNKLAHVKIEMAEGRPAVNFGAQELMIQQLQDEIKHLRQLQKGEESISDVVNFDPKLGQGQGLTTNAIVAQLQQKLRTAAKHIQQLTKDKQQLIEMGNRLRAEQKNNGLQASSVPRVQPNIPTQHPAINPVQSSSGNMLQHKIQSKLQQLEQLQYELTKQELARSPVRPAYVPPVHLQPSSTESESDREYQPQSILKKPVHTNSLTKLSPVPENIVTEGRPRTAPEVLTPARIDGVPTNHRTSSPTREVMSAGLLASVSSIGGGESIQEIWRMLDDEANTSRPFTPLNSGPFNGLQFPGDNQYARQKSADSLVLKGQKPVTESKTTSRNKKLSDKAAGKVGAIKASHKPKIRNYNMKDDTSVK